MSDAVLVLDDFLPFRLSYTSNLVSDTIARAYEVLFGLSIPEWRVVAVVAETGGITQRAIGRKTRMDKVTVSRAAISLVGRGLMARQPHSGDRRSHMLVLTDQGRALHGAIAPKALDLEARIFARLGEEETRRFVDTLRRIDAVVLDLAEDVGETMPGETTTS